MPAVDRRLLRAARATRVFLVLSALIGTAQAGLILTQAWLLASVISDAFIDGAGLAELRGRVIALTATLVARAALSWTSEVVAQRSSAAVKSELRLRLLDRMVALGPRWLTGERSGELTHLATRGIDALDDYFARYLPQLVLVCVVPLVVAARMLAADWLSALIVVVTLPLIPIFMVLVGLTTKSLMARQWSTLQSLAHHFLDVLSGLGTLKTFGRSKAQVEVIGRLADRQRRATLATLRLAFLSSLVLELLATLSVALVAVSIGLRLVEGRLDLETALLVLILAPEAYLPLRLLGTHYHASAEGLAAADQVFAVLDQPTPAPSSGRPHAPDPGVLPELFLDRVTVVTPDRASPALDRYSLRIPAGQITGIVGPSGSGKSTILGLLRGAIEPDEGHVLVATPLNLAAETRSAAPPPAVDLADVDRDVWRSRVAWLGQDPVLFAGSVADNIRLGRPDAGGVSVRRAAARAQVDVRLDLVLGERGQGVSAGQRRRIALARALLLDAPVLLLDEPTEGVDPATEDALVHTLPAALTGRTVVLVTHRPALLDLCHHIIHLDRTEVPA